MCHLERLYLAAGFDENHDPMSSHVLYRNSVVVSSLYYGLKSEKGNCFARAGAMAARTLFFCVSWLKLPLLDVIPT